MFGGWGMEEGGGVEMGEMEAVRRAQPASRLGVS